MITYWALLASLFPQHTVTTSLIGLSEVEQFEGEKTLTFSAPASIHSLALASVMPPPACSPAGHAASASLAASALPGPSIMTCAPVRSLSRYNLAKCAGG